MGDRLPLLLAAVAGAGAYHACSSAASSSGAKTKPSFTPTPTNAGEGKTIGILHPGTMGASIGFNAKLNGARVVWAGDGRSKESYGRAAKADLEDVGTLANMGPSVGPAPAATSSPPTSWFSAFLSTTYALLLTCFCASVRSQWRRAA